MGITYIEGVVTGAEGKQATVQFLVDSGATSTLLPHREWQAIGLAPKRSVLFTLADGTKIERQVSECHMSLPQGDGHTPVILGEPGDEALLGTVTLEILGLVLNSFSRSLHPMRMKLARIRALPGRAPSRRDGRQWFPPGTPFLQRSPASYRMEA